MFIRKYHYTEVDGNHWPDANTGDALYYSIDFSCWLNEEEDNINSITWIIPSGVEKLDEYVDGTEAAVKLSTSLIGSFRVICELSSEEHGKTQINSVPMMLKVV